MARLPSRRFVAPGDDLAPDFYLDISGKTAKGSGLAWDWIRPIIISCTYEEDEEMAGQLELKISNRMDDGLNAAGSGAVYATVNWEAVLNSKAFQEGNFVDLYMGYGGQQEFMGRTEIVKWLPDFGPAGPVEFEVKAHDARHKMMRSNEFRVKQGGSSRKRKTYYSNLTDDEIVAKIARKYGYAAETDAPKLKRRGTKTKKVVRVQPSDLDDWAFLQKLADINRFDLWVAYDQARSQNVVHFKERMDSGSGNFVFTYNGEDGSLIEAKPDFAISDQPTDVEVLFFDRTRKTIERTIISDTNPAEDVRLTSASPGNLSVKKELTKGARVRFSAFGQVVEALADRPFRSKKEAKEFVTNWLKERERDFLILKGKVVGVESLRPRQIHELTGMCTRLNGLYRFTQVKHVMEVGEIYNCEFTAYKVLAQEVARRKATTKIVTKQKKVAAG